jgi:uncharacterized protein
MGKRWVIAGIGLVVCLVLARADTDSLLASLRPQGYVSDFAGVMSPADREATERLLTDLERSAGNQIAVVTVKSLDGGQIDDFATRLFERWGIGHKGRNDGILLLAAIEERKIRIEVGYGMEGHLPDAAAGRLIDQHVLPAFRLGDPSGGLRAGALALADVAAQAAGVEWSARSSPAAPPPPAHIGWGHVVFLILVILVLIRYPWLFLLLLQSSGSSRGGGGFGGGGFGGFGGGLSGGGGASRGW